jgi:hypothetical protein
MLPMSELKHTGITETQKVSTGISLSRARRAAVIVPFVWRGADVESMIVAALTPKRVRKSTPPLATITASFVSAARAQFLPRPTEIV